MLGLIFPVVLVLICQSTWTARADWCVENSIVKSFGIMSPENNALITSPYYLVMLAELFIGIDNFRLRESEFELCARATLETQDGEQVAEKEIYRECGLPIFSPGNIVAEQGVNHLVLSLFHGTEQLCETTVTVSCCVDSKSSQKEMKEKKLTSMLEFRREGSMISSNFASTFGSSIPKSDELFISQTLGSKLAQLVAEDAEFQSQQPPKIKILVGIKSSALNIAKRQNIRRTWLSSAKKIILKGLVTPAEDGGAGMDVSDGGNVGDSTPDTHDNADVDVEVVIVPYFLIGDSAHARINSAVNVILQQEQLLYNDTLLAAQLPVEDSYYTLGQKILTFLAWTYGGYNQQQQHSPISAKSINPDFVVICDDDVFVDVWQLATFLQLLMQTSKLNTFYGGEVSNICANQILISLQTRS